MGGNKNADVVNIDSGSEKAHEDAGGLATKGGGAFSSHLTEAQFSHCHPQLEPHRDRRVGKTLIFVSILTTVFIAAEFTVAGGYIANSLAIMTDAGHMLSDLLSFLISLFAIYVARRPATMRLSFGFYRAEILGAICSIFIIWVLTGILVYLAIIRVIHNEFDIDADLMLITAGVGVVFNIIMGIALHYGGGHGHSHFGGSSHSHTHDSGHEHSHENGASKEVISVNRHKNINIRAAFVHVIGDLVQSVGVMIAALVIKFTGWKLADPVCTFLFSALVLITTLMVMRDAVLVLMEGTPRDVSYAAVKNDLQKIEGVLAAHSLHMWSLTMDKAALSVHLAINASEDALKVMQKANQMMQSKYNVAFTTIQVEPFDIKYMTSCKECVGPVK
uniref:Solute carrier family 30 member 2 n=1 Tax=Plectus sambesii TaxID=2011161 RepID=A0A914VVU7_9BILA